MWTTLKAEAGARFSLWPFRCICYALLSFPLALSAAPGDLDTSFGTNGIVTTVVDGDNSQAISIVNQLDGKILVVGDAFSLTPYKNIGALVRYEPDGTLDISFDNDGVLLLPNGDGFNRLEEVIQQPDGKILITGVMHGINSDSHFGMSVVRLLSDGSLDKNFGDNGLAGTPKAVHSGAAYALTLQPDGKILTLGSGGATGDTVLALVRYLKDGTLDMDFGVDGITTTDIGWDSSSERDIVIQPDGKILVLAQRFSVAKDKYQMILLRYLQDGQLDTSFGNNGITKLPSGVDGSHAYNLLVDPDGRILVSGRFNGSDAGIVVIRTLADGQLDTSFGSNGVTKIQVSPKNDGTRAMALQPDGKILIAGYTLDPDIDVVVSRLLPDGSIDTVFGANGITVVHFTDMTDGPDDMAIQPDGGILVTGVSDSDMMIARFEGDFFDTTPDAFSFSSVTKAKPSSLEYSEIVTVTGLDNNVVAPVVVTGGEYAIDAGSYTNNIGYVRNGQTISVRQVTADTGPTQQDTLLSIGGYHSPNNYTVILGEVQQGTFTTTTKAVVSSESVESSGSEGDGGGSGGCTIGSTSNIDPVWLFILFVSGAGYLQRHSIRMAEVAANKTA
jgi:uncharacterized delta-60 repeat protein